VILDGRGLRGVEEKRSRSSEQMTTAQFQALVYQSVGLGSVDLPVGQEGR